MRRVSMLGAAGPGEQPSDLEAGIAGAVPEEVGAVVDVRASGRWGLAFEIGKRLLFSLAAILLASVIIFAATSALPGNYATTTLGQTATSQSVEALKHQLGLERSVEARYISWLGGVVHGDLGESYTGVSAWSLIHTRLLNSMALALMAVLFTVPLAVTVGIWTGLRAGGVGDNIVGVITLAAVALPEFVVGLLIAALIGIVIGLLPPTSIIPPTTTGFSHPDLLILPAAAAASVTIGYIARMTRAATIDVMQTEYIQAARLRGIGGWELVSRHVLRNALIPALAVIGNQTAWMLTGLVAIELVFAYPGLGSLLVGAISTRDIPLVAAVSLIITTAFVTVNFLTDTMALILNPRATAQR
jgi:peptide/nickel transport system permease protein